MKPHCEQKIILQNYSSDIFFTEFSRLMSKIYILLDLFYSVYMVLLCSLV